MQAVIHERTDVNQSFFFIYSEKPATPLYFSLLVWYNVRALIFWDLSAQKYYFPFGKVLIMKENYLL